MLIHKKWSRLGSVAAAAALIAWSAGPAFASTGSDTVPGEVLVKLRNESALNALVVKYGLTTVDRFGSRPIFRLKVIGAGDVDSIVAGLAAEPTVLIAEPNFVQSTPEARRNQPWAIGTPQAFGVQWAPYAMRLPETYRRATGEGVRVAVLDTGVDRTHPLLRHRLLPGFDFVDFDNDPSEVGNPADAGFGHGTHVAGLVAMVAPGAKIVPYRVLDAAGRGNAWVLAEALLRAVDPDGNPATDDGAHVVNLSLGTLDRTRILESIAQLVSCTPPDPSRPETEISDAGYEADRVRCSRFGGVVVVAASGNDASGSVKEYPAAEGFKGLIAVTATSADGKLARFSNYGSWVHVAAPGESITSAFPGGGYATWSGTSMAAPLAAGTAALLRQAEPLLRPDEIARRLQQTASVLCGTNLRQLDAAAALGATPSPTRVCR